MSLQLLEYKPEDGKTSFADKQAKINEKKKQVIIDSARDISSIQACVMPHGSSPSAVIKNDPSKKDCLFSAATIIAKKHAAYKLPNSSPDILKIVSGFDKNATEIECNINGLISPCAIHKSKVFDLAFKDEASSLEDSNVKFKARSIAFYKIFDNGVLFPWDAKISTYKILANTCGKQVQKTIEVYPDVKVEVDIPFQFTQSREKHKEYSNTGKSSWQKEQSEKKLEISATYKEDGREWKVSQNINKKFEELKELVRLAEQIKSTVQKAFDESIKIESKLPAGKLHLDFTFSEIDNYGVDAEWNALIQLSPLCGGTLTIALDEIILKTMTGPVGTVYSKVKRILEKYDVEIKFEFSASGEISLDSGLKKKAGADVVQSGAGLCGKIEFQLKSAGNYQFQKIIYAEGAVEAGIKCNVSGSAFLFFASGIKLDTKIEFSGVVFYYEVKITGGYLRKSKKKKEESAKTGAAMSKEFVFGAPKEPLLNKTFEW